MGDLRCALLGSTGMVGQRFIQLLEGHPFLKLELLFSSEDRSGHYYGETTEWVLEGTIPDRITDLKLCKFDPSLLKDNKIDVVFSALPGSIKKDIEKEAAISGSRVFSNSAAHRYDKDVPIIIPEINSEHMDLVSSQDTYPEGFIVTNPNCSTSGLAMSLAPLTEMGISKVFVSTYQALSGAGLSGLSSLSMQKNIIPFIKNEEEKISRETGKILGKLVDDRIDDIPVRIYPSCARVPVRDGHLISVHVELDRKITSDEASEAFRSLPPMLGLPSAPGHPIIVMEDEDRPQPQRDVSNGTPMEGMSVSIGRIRIEGNILSYFALVNNTIRGGAGNAILSAEMAQKMNYLGGG